MNGIKAGRSTPVPIRAERAGLSAIIAMAVLGAATPALAQSSSGALEEVVVTAEKVAEPLSRVPASIAVLTAAALEGQNVVDLQDIVNRVPGLSANAGGVPGYSQYSIRGISPGGGYETTTGMYIDDISVNMGNSGFGGAFEPAFLDMDRVEVLRGPQGTLYGSGSFGGTIRFVTAQPDLSKQSADVAADLHGQYRGTPGESARAVVNLPLIQDALALRLAALYQHDGGFINHLSPTDYRRDTNVQDIYAFRGSILWHPSDGLTITPTLNYQQTRSGDTWFYDRSLGAYNTPRDMDEPFDDRFVLGGVVTKAKLGIHELTLVSGYVDRRNSGVRDYTVYDTGYVASLIAPYFDPTGALGALDRIAAIPTGALQTDTDTQASQEIRLASHYDEIRLTTLFGIEYIRETRRKPTIETASGLNAVTEELFGLSADEALSQSAGSPSDLGDVLYNQDTTRRFNRRAVYGEATWTATDKLKLTAGIRYSNISSRYYGWRDGFFNGGPSTFDQSFSEKQAAPKYKLAYQATEDVLIYASAAKGFRLGSPNQPFPSSCDAEIAALGFTPPPSYATDSIWNYEVGTKLRALDRRLQVNASAFYIRWSSIAEALNLPACGFNFNGNFGNAISRGADLEVHAALIEGLELGAAVAYTDARFSSDFLADGIEAGSRVPFSVPWTATANASYSWGTPWGSTIVRADYQFTDVSRGDLNLGSPNFQRPSYSTVGMSAGTGYHEWQYDVFVKNLTNSQPALQQDASLGYYNVSTLRPRTIGLKFQRSF